MAESTLVLLNAIQFKKSPKKSLLPMILNVCGHSQTLPIMPKTEELSILLVTSLIETRLSLVAAMFFYEWKNVQRDLGSPLLKSMSDKKDRKEQGLSYLTTTLSCIV